MQLIIDCHVCCNTFQISLLFRHFCYSTFLFIFYCSTFLSFDVFVYLCTVRHFCFYVLYCSTFLFVYLCTFQHFCVVMYCIIPHFCFRHFCLLFYKVARLRNFVLIEASCNFSHIGHQYLFYFSSISVLKNSRMH